MLQSRNYVPSRDLAPFVRNHFVFRVNVPDDFVLVDQLLCETAMIRILISGNWQARFADGPWRKEGPTILFGANARTFEVRVQGPFVVVGASLRPSGWPCLFSQPADTYTDDMASLDTVWPGTGDTLYDRVKNVADDDDAIITAIEHTMREQLLLRPRKMPDPKIITFEEISLSDSTTLVGDAAASLGLSMPTLKRRCNATFGLPPKAVLRRSRFLDMATAKRNISAPDDAEKLALRFSDQSHLNREFRHFIGMTPGEFERTPTPLLDAVLRLRHERAG